MLALVVDDQHARFGSVRHEPIMAAPVYASLQAGWEFPVSRSGGAARRRGGQPGSSDGVTANQGHSTAHGAVDPLETEPAAPPGDETAGDIERFATTIVHGPAAAMTGTSGVFGIPLPRDATPDPDRAGFTLAVDVGTIQDMVDFYRDWMAIDGWIFDADFGNSDPYAMEEQPFAGGYFAQLFFTKPTTPPTTVGIVIGNADGRPGHKPDLTISIAQTPDDELPRRSLRLD